MVKRIINKYFGSTKVFKKLITLRRDIRTVYWDLIGYDVDKRNLKRFKKVFKGSMGRYDLTPDELDTARKHGIYPGSYVIYNFDKWSIDQFFSDRDMFNLISRICGLNTTLKDKRNLPLLFQRAAHYLPNLNLAIDKGRVQYIIEDGVYREDIFDLKELLEACLLKHNKLIVKPHNLSQGRRIFIISEILTEKTLQEIQGMDGAMINNVLINEEYAHKINPHTLNTIRVYFFKTKDGFLKTLSMFHRFGSNDESPVDNYSAGGVAAGMDQETGEFIEVFTMHRKRINIDSHPVTGHKLVGFKIPDWSSKKRQIYDLMQEINYLEFGGLDVAFTTEGLKIIEINVKFPHSGVMQISSPALIDKEFVEFLRIRGLDIQTPTKIDKT